MAGPKQQLKLHESLPVGSKSRAKLRAVFTPRTVHGGHEAIGKRKTPRPFSPKAPTHIVLYSSRAKGLWSLNHRKNRAQVLSQIYVYAARFKVHVYRAANVGNHIHLLVKSEDRKQMADYLRVLAGRVAITVTGAKKHSKKIGKFWDSLCWSRLVNFGRDFYNTRMYVLAHGFEIDSSEHREWIRKSGQWMAKHFGVSAFERGS